MKTHIRPPEEKESQELLLPSSWEPIIIIILCNSWE